MYGCSPDSGGKGKYRGGSGVTRVLQFRKQLQVSILSERRSVAPYGLDGGGSGARGRNTCCRGGKWVNLGAKASVAVAAGDMLRIDTPGGGGYGVATVDGAAGGADRGRATGDDQPAGAESTPFVPHATGSVHEYATTQLTA